METHTSESLHPKRHVFFLSTGQAWYDSHSFLFRLHTVCDFSVQVASGMDAKVELQINAVAACDVDETLRIQTDFGIVHVPVTATVLSKQVLILSIALAFILFLVFFTSFSCSLFGLLALLRLFLFCSVFYSSSLPSHDGHNRYLKQRRCQQRIAGVVSAFFQLDLSHQLQELNTRDVLMCKV